MTLAIHFVFFSELVMNFNLETTETKFNVYPAALDLNDLVPVWPGPIRTEVSQR